MSAWIGHVFGALTLTRLFMDRPTKKEVGAIGLVAIAPDLVDLLVGVHPSASHSLLAVTVFAIIGWVSSSLWAKSPFSPRLFLVLLVAAHSHMLFDVLANRPTYVLLWPFSDAKYGVAHGILPAAPGLSLTNYYFYRNLLLETAIFIPPFLLLRRRHEPITVAMGALAGAVGLFVSTTMIR